MLCAEIMEDEEKMTVVCTYSVAYMDEEFSPLRNVILSLMSVCVSLLHLGLFPLLTEKAAAAAFC